MNTYGDPGADPVEEWRVERMTDTITPASLRAHADHFAGRWHLVSEALIDEAARLEAESARDEEAERLAEVYRVAFKAASAGNAPNSWAVAGIRAVLDRLEADGRLLPEGGTVLTYDEGTLHRVYAALGNAGLSHRVAEDAVNEMQNLGILFREREVTPPAEPVPDSGPDGTPEKPWPTAADVPDGVWFRSAKNRHWPARWLRCGNGSTDYADMVNPKTAALGFQVWDVSAVNDFAPFVRVDGDK